ncbi:hypothetical protein ONZ45_g7140 [Pleurotus djamor]|nr:hypothetical protein ONZ45_g7140 [Pleurotus djamor]
MTTTISTVALQHRSQKRQLQLSPNREFSAIIRASPRTIPTAKTGSSNGIVSDPKAGGDNEEDLYGEGKADAPEEEESESAEADEESEDDIEIIMEPHSRSLDLRNQTRTSSRPAAPKSSQPSLTTEYTPIARGEPAKPTQPQPRGTPLSAPQPSQAPQTSSTSLPSQQSTTKPAPTDDGPDPSNLPAATAPPSHPDINPDIPGVFDGRSILDVDLSSLADKPWRRPGSDISDWFNYGFDEISWEAYCYRRRDLGELGNILKQNVVNFAGMPEDQLTALPPEVRQMVMTGATTLMNNGGPNANMMGGMNPMMDMAMMNPMAMGMNGDMGMQMQGGGPMMDGTQMSGMMAEGGGPGQAAQNAGADQGSSVGVSVPGMGNQMMGNEGFPNGPVPNMMGGDFGGGMQPYGMDGQDQGQMFQTIEAQPPVQPVQPVMPQGGRGGGFPYRARGQPIRGRGYAPRGRGRGMYGEGKAFAFFLVKLSTSLTAVPALLGPPAPVRPASPLPPGVPTGPRNQNKYKDRDGNAAAVDGLDYGGTKDGGHRTPSGEPEERSSSRKRRGSPGADDVRGSKRR